MTIAAGEVALPFTGTARFQLMDQLGQGSMGVVYRVHDRETDTDVALKTLPARSADQLFQLKQEFRALSDIVHPNLVELYELLVDEAQQCFTMELVEGADFVTHVRSGAGSDLARWRDAARQLVLGLAAVHAAGKLHRDVKPSNVSVAPDGRVVLLDFGLATALASDGAAGPPASSVAGTFAYMAPELWYGEAASPAADWYSVGVMLFEALAGRLPFEGDAGRVLQMKRRPPPPSLRATVPEVPADVDAIVSALLHPDPTQRPEAVALLRALGGAPGGTVNTARRDAPFVGRQAERARLHALRAAVRDRQAAVVHIAGPSGIGKSELVRRFLAELAATESRLVLAGRCHPHEVVPYKAFDAVIDALSGELQSRPTAAVAALLPDGAATLCRLFPVLGRVPACAALAPVLDDVDPHELRRQGFEALRGLLTRLADERLLVLWIDDLQWSDVDSAALLRHVLRPPAPAMLVLLSYRSDERAAVSFLDDLARHPGPSALRQDTIELAPLDPGDTRALAASLCRAQVASDQHLEALVAEAAGNPFFIGEIARAVADGRRMDTLHLADVIRERVEHLPEPARRVLEMASVAGGPTSRSVLLAAAGLGERGRALVSQLERRSLLRSTATNEQSAIEMYHDRIREALLATLSADVRRARHGELADTLLQDAAPDPEVLFRHSLGAERTEQAGHWAVKAADRADDALAFDRAAGLYQQALALHPPGIAAWVLHAKRGAALAHAGRGGEAGECFDAAAVNRTDAPAAADAILAFRLQAADQYLRAGQLTRGAERLREVLRELGVPLPQTKPHALASSAWQRLRLLVHGIGFTPRPAADLSPRTQLRIDACWAATTKLSVLDTVLADGVGVRCLIEALNAGERTRIIRALAFEVARQAALDLPILDRPRARLTAAVERLGRDGDDPYERAWLHQCMGGSAYFTGYWRRGYEGCAAAAATWRAHCRGVAWEVATAESFALSALAHMGELRELGRQLPAAIGDAEARGDAYACTGLRMGMPSLLWLAQDRPDDVRELAEREVARWPRDKFLVQHYLHLLAAVQADLYSGAGWAAWQRVCAAWPKVRRSSLLNVAIARVDLRYLRARAALAAAATPPDPGAIGAALAPAWPRARLLREAQAEARRLLTDRMPAADVFAVLIRSALASAEGRDGAAVAKLSAAATAAAMADMGLYAAAARMRLGTLTGGGGGREVQEAARAWMSDQGVTDPATLAAMLVVQGAASTPTTTR